MAASILRATGRKVGLYTSPHLVRFNERIRIGGIPIPDEWIISFLKKYRVEIDLLGLDLEAGLTTFYGGLGYRYQKDTGGLVFRLNGYYLMMGDAGSVSTVGISLGWAF